MSNLWKDIDLSDVIAGVIALACVGAMIFLSIVEKPIPEVLTNVSITAVAFYFGTKNGQSSAIARLAHPVK